MRTGSTGRSSSRTSPAPPAASASSGEGRAGRRHGPAVHADRADGIFPHVYDNLAYDPVRDFQPISQVGTFDLGMAVGANVPARNLKELMDWLKTHPDQAASGRRLRDRYRTSLRCCSRAPRAWIFVTSPTRATRRPSPISSAVTAYALYLDAGSRRGSQGWAYPCPRDIGPGRSTALPEVPTFTESGYGIRGEGWHGIYAPARTPVEVVAQLNRAVVEAVRTDRIQQAADAARRPTDRHIGQGNFKDSEIRLRIVGAGGQGFWLQARVKAALLNVVPDLFRVRPQNKRGRLSWRPLRISSLNQRFCWASTAPGISVVTARSPIFFPISLPTSVENR